MITRVICNNVNDVYVHYFRFTDVLEHYQKGANCLTSTEEWIWRVLTSSRFSRFSQKMHPYQWQKNYDYIQKCVTNSIPIHIVLAGFPGKCANRTKVLHRTPDIGELATLAQLDLLNRIVQTRHLPGIKVTFFTDYICLKYSFFPQQEDIDLYERMVSAWIIDLALPVELIRANKVFPQANAHEVEFLELVSNMDGFCNYIRECPDNPKLFLSMNDNICITSAKDFYMQRIGEVPSDECIVKACVRFYTDFWEKWNSSNAVEQYFGDVIYGSPVSYHPEKRLCLRLQPSAARVAPWNGCGIVANNKVYSIDERICVKEKLFPIYDTTGFFWGYSK